MVAFVALPVFAGNVPVLVRGILVDVPVSLTGIEAGMAPREIGPQPEPIAVLMWLFLAGALGSLCVAVRQLMRPRPGTDRRGLVIAALSGVAFLIYLGLLVALLMQPVLPRRGSAVSVLSAGFGLGQIGALVAVIGGCVAFAATRRSAAGPV